MTHLCSPPATMNVKVQVSFPVVHSGSCRRSITEAEVDETGRVTEEQPEQNYITTKLSESNC